MFVIRVIVSNHQLEQRTATAVQAGTLPVEKVCMLLPLAPPAAYHYLTLHCMPLLQSYKCMALRGIKGQQKVGVRQVEREFGRERQATSEQQGRAQSKQHVGTSNAALIPRRSSPESMRTRTAPPPPAKFRAMGGTVDDWKGSWHASKRIVC